VLSRSLCQLEQIYFVATRNIDCKEERGVMVSTNGITRELRNPILFAPLVVAVRLFMFPGLLLKNRASQGDCLLIRAVKF